MQNPYKPKRFGEALRELEKDGINRKALDIMRLWMLTGCHREEIASLKWQEVVFEHGCLRFGDTKTGKAVRPIRAAAIAAFETIERADHSAFVFPAGEGDGYFRGYMTPWKKGRREGSPARRNVAHPAVHNRSTAIPSDEAMAFTGAILGHANPQSTAIYAHVQHNPARRAADRVAERIAAALAGMSDLEVDASAPDKNEDLLRRVAETPMRAAWSPNVCGTCSPSWRNEPRQTEQPSLRAKALVAQNQIWLRIDTLNCAVHFARN